MTSLQRFLPITLILVVALLVAACGGSATSSNPTPTATTAPTAAPTTAPTTAPSALIMTAMATVNGTAETILTNAQGLTLYYRTSDSPPSTVCSDGCALVWPPLLAPSSGPPTSATSLPGKLTVVVDANGNQVEYNGHPLYTFSGDRTAGQTYGAGVSNSWFVVTPDLK